MANILDEILDRLTRIESFLEGMLPPLPGEPQDPPDVEPVDKWAVSDARLGRTGNWWWKSGAFRPKKVNKIPVGYVRTTGKATVFTFDKRIKNGTIRVKNESYEGGPVGLNAGETLMVLAMGDQFTGWPDGCRPFQGEGGDDVFHLMDENYSQRSGLFIGKMDGAKYVKAKDVEVV